MTSKNNRIQREKKTVKAMAAIYCRANHKQKNQLCPECQKLLDYSLNRLDRCKFGENKRTCKNCTVHCYKEPEKTKIKDIMRFSGPRMLFKHPVLAIQHIFDGSKG